MVPGVETTLETPDLDTDFVVLFVPERMHYDTDFEF